MAIKKQNSHTSTRKKKAASKAVKPTRKSKASNERPAWLKRRDELTLKMFQEIYEDYQQGKFHRIM